MIGSRKNGGRKGLRATRQPATGLRRVLALVAHAPIVVEPAAPRAMLADWEEKRNSAEVDALVLAWIASHVRGPQHRGRLN
jgi:hypothetical protein